MAPERVEPAQEEEDESLQESERREAERKRTAAKVFNIFIL